MQKRNVLSALCACCAALFALPDAALALSNAEHKEMLKNSPAYAKADAELNQAWKGLRAALKKAGLEQQFDGGTKPPNLYSLLASQQAWLSRLRDGEAEELRGAGSEADAYAAATRKRAAYLRRLAEELNRFAALPAPAADAPLMRLLKANGGSLYFEACEDEEEAEGSASAGGTSSPATLCANLGSSLQRLEINADGDLRSFTAGRPENPMNLFRWKLAADGSVITANWEGTDTHDFTLQDGRYLRWEDAHNIPARWFVLYEENRQPQESGAQKPAQAKPQEAAKAAAAAPAKTYTNSIGMEFVLIAAGTFQMGCSSEAEECSDDEKPRHEVTISKPFYLGKYEVTQAQWQAVMGSNPSAHKGANHPVENVTWLDAQEFIKKLNAKEGHNRYRLPTEAEWEYAARAGSTTVYSFGNDAGRLKNYAWYEGNSGEVMHPVGRKQPNAWGLFDMHGNVMEWVQDWYGAYSPEAAVDPQGPEAGEGHVLRGGGSINFAKVCRSAFRGDGTDFYGGSRDDDFGFRLALTPEQ